MQNEGGKKVLLSRGEKGEILPTGPNAPASLLYPAFFRNFAAIDWSLLFFVFVCFLFLVSCSVKPTLSLFLFCSLLPLLLEGNFRLPFVFFFFFFLLVTQTRTTERRRLLAGEAVRARFQGARSHLAGRQGRD